jgi:GR25 family glycosyltransferase involved in LPS biosynthesis
MLYDKILYINLDHRLDRKKNVEDQLKKLNLMDITTRIDAVNGKKLDLDKIPKELISARGIRDAKEGKKLYLYLTMGAIGCALSHKKCYQYIVDNNINKCLILEDDLTFDDNFNEKLNMLEENGIIPKDFDVLFLGYHKSYVRNKTNDILFKCGQTFGLFGYIISNKAAKKFLSRTGIFPLTRQIDYEMYYQFGQGDMGLKAYSLNAKNRLIFSEESQNAVKFGTDIQVKNQFEETKKSTEEPNVIEQMTNTDFNYTWIVVIICLFGLGYLIRQKYWDKIKLLIKN